VANESSSEKLLKNLPSWLSQTSIDIMEGGGDFYGIDIEIFLSGHRYKSEIDSELSEE